MANHIFSISYSTFICEGGLNQILREVTHYHYNIKNIFMLFQLHGIIFGDLDFRLGLLYEHLLHRYHLFSNLKTFLFVFMSIFFFSMTSRLILAQRRPGMLILKYLLQGIMPCKIQIRNCLYGNII